jgi:hypothetical protein
MIQQLNFELTMPTYGYPAAPTTANASLTIGQNLRPEIIRYHSWASLNQNLTGLNINR